jgi:hypothetical protein
MEISARSAPLAGALRSAGGNVTVERLLNVPKTDGEWADWTFANAQCIQEIAAAIAQQKGITLPNYVLYPLNWKDRANWMIRLQQSHDDFNSVLGLQGVNLQDTDLTDERQRPSFVFNVWIETSNARAALKI